MYMQPKKPGEVANQKPASTIAETVPNNYRLATFEVSAGKWFQLGDYHKFHIYKRNDSIKVEYCQPCSRIRAAIGIQRDYVKDALDSYTALPLDQYDRQQVIDSFTSHLIGHYIAANSQTDVK